MLFTIEWHLGQGKEHPEPALNFLFVFVGRRICNAEIKRMLC